MKKILILFVLAGIAFTGCNPVEDINNSIEDDVVVGVAEFTMTSDDYEAIVDQDDDADPDYYETFEAFSDIEDARLMLPDFIADRYSFWGEGSSVTVNFNLYDGNPVDASTFVNSEVYSLTNDDYATTGSDAFGFYPDVDPTDEIPAVLLSEIVSPADGQLVLARYDQYFETPEVGFANVYAAPFPDVYSTYENIDVSGDVAAWSEGTAHANAAAFNGNNNAGEDWLISPEINLSDASNLKFQINQRISFLNGFTASDYINILVSTDYTTGGDPMVATWDVITLETVPSGDTSDFILSEDYDFSAYDNSIIHVAFKYTPTVESAPLWRIDFFNIKTVGVTGDTDSKGEYFVYEGGSWEEAEGVYYLSAADYDSMGENSGQPGRFNNFSGSVATSDYLPQFLALEFPFAQEEDEIFIVYRFFRGGAQGTTTRGNLYTFSNGEWIQSTSSLKLGFKNGVWVPDNTIRYTLASSDYSAVVSELAGVAGFEAAVDNLDSFGNFSRSGGSSNWSDSMIETALNVILDNLDPGAEELQKYVVTIATWAPGNSTEDFAVIKDSGVWRFQTDED